MSRNYFRLGSLSQEISEKFIRWIEDPNILSKRVLLDKTHKQMMKNYFFLKQSPCSMVYAWNQLPLVAVNCHQDFSFSNLSQFTCEMFNLIIPHLYFSPHDFCTQLQEKILSRVP